MTDIPLGIATFEVLGYGRGYCSEEQGGRRRVFGAPK